MNDIKYYSAALILFPVAVAKGVWATLKQFPARVSSSVGSTKRTLDETYKTEETGKTERERRIEALKPNRK